MAAASQPADASSLLIRRSRSVEAKRGLEVAAPASDGAPTVTGEHRTGTVSPCKRSGKKRSSDANPQRPLTRSRSSPHPPCLLSTCKASRRTSPSSPGEFGLNRAG